MSDETDRQVQRMADAAAQAAEDDDDDEDEDETETTEGAKRVQPGLYISTPPVLKEKIEAEAVAAGVTARVLVRDLLAKHWGLTLPEPRTRSTYKSPEEKAEAQKAKRMARAELIKQLLAEHRAKQLESAPAGVAVGVEEGATA